MQAASRPVGSPRHYAFISSSPAQPPSAAPSPDSGLAVSRASLYRSLNRCVLFQLSRPVLKQRDQKLAISMFQLLLAEEGPLNAFIFSSFNSNDTEFPVCLAHLLIQHVQRNHHEVDEEEAVDLLESSPPTKEMHEVTTESILFYKTAFDTEDFETDVDEDAAPSKPLQKPDLGQQEDLPAQQEEFEQLATLAHKVWKHCYMWNQRVFLDLLPNSPLSQLAGVPSLTKWSSVLEGPCIMKWTTYVDAEATGCGGIVSQNASTAPTPQWGLLYMYGPSTIERQLESTNNKVTGADQSAVDQPRPPGRGLSHQISKKLGRMGASVLRMASNSSSTSSSTSITEVTSTKAAEVNKQGRHFSVVDPVGVSAALSRGSRVSDTDWVLIPRIPVGLPLLTKKSTTLSTLKVGFCV